MGNPQGHLSLQRKHKNVYEIKKNTWCYFIWYNIFASFIKNNEALKLLDTEIRKYLFNKSQELENLLHENDLLLKTRMETSQTVIDSIVNAGKLTKKSNATSYGYKRGYSLFNKNKSSREGREGEDGEN